jgi:hypothetical protein
MRLLVLLVRLFLALFNGSRAGTVAARGGRQRGMRFPAVVAAQLIGFVLVDRAGVGDFLGNAKFMQLVDDLTRLHFQLSRQFIDSNLTHIEAFRLTAFIRLLDLPHSGLGYFALIDFRPGWTLRARARS